MSKFATKWFRISSWIWFHRNETVEVDLFNGKQAILMGWRNAWFGPALRLLVHGEDRISDGWDPATVIRMNIVGSAAPIPSTNGDNSRVTSKVD